MGNFSGADPGFSVGQPHWGGDRYDRHRRFSAKIFVKTKELGPFLGVGVGRGTPQAPPGSANNFWCGRCHSTNTDSRYWRMSVHLKMINSSINCYVHTGSLCLEAVEYYITQAFLCFNYIYIVTYTQVLCALGLLNTILHKHFCASIITEMDEKSIRNDMIKDFKKIS